MTAKQSQLKDLERRLAEAREPDREIDLAIAKSLFGISAWKSKHGYWNVSIPTKWPFCSPAKHIELPGRDCGDVYDSATGTKLPPEDEPGGYAYEIECPEWTASLDAAVSLVEMVLPGWFWTTGKCKLNAHATVGPDRDGPDAYLLKDPTFDNGFDADMEHGIPALALCLACVRALIAQGEK